jgi:hypothetical protein
MPLPRLAERRNPVRPGQPYRCYPAQVGVGAAGIIRALATAWILMMDISVKLALSWRAQTS